MKLSELNLLNKHFGKDVALMGECIVVVNNKLISKQEQEQAIKTKLNNYGRGKTK